VLVRRWFALLALAAASVLPAVSTVAALGAEGDCASSLTDWQTARGALQPGLACGSFVGTTDGWGGPFSAAEFRATKPVSLPLEVEVTWRRLGSDGGESLTLILPGGFLLLKRGEYGFYGFSESAFKWVALPGFSTHRESTVRVVQRATEILIWVDGKAIGRVPFTAPSASGPVGVGIKGASGYRSRMMFRGFRVRALGEAPAGGR
jgi:hypothetical protein